MKRLLVGLSGGWIVGMVVALAVASLFPVGFFGGLVIGFACTQLGMLVGATVVAR
jgi:hypothetical protein